MNHQRIEQISVLLKPCPFCGAAGRGVGITENPCFIHDDIAGRSIYYKSRYQVICGQCAAHSALCEKPEQALECWNRRAKE